MRRLKPPNSRPMPKPRIKNSGAFLFFGKATPQAAFQGYSFEVSVAFASIAIVARALPVTLASAACTDAYFVEPIWQTYAVVPTGAAPAAAGTSAPALTAREAERTARKNRFFIKFILFPEFAQNICIYCTIFLHG